MLNFVNQGEDKDGELVVQNLRLTIFRRFQMDSRRNKIRGRYIVSYLIHPNLNLDEGNRVGKVF